MRNTTDLTTGGARHKKTANTTSTAPGKAVPRKPAATKDIRTTASAKATRKSASLGGRVRISAAERHHLIAEAAYLRAEHRGFSSGDPVIDWLAAEVEIDTALSRRH